MSNPRPELNQHQPDRDPVVDDDFDPAAEPEPEVEDPGVFFGLGEALVLRDDLSREKMALEPLFLENIISRIHSRNK